MRKKAEKDAAKKTIAGVGDARLRYTHPFDPNGVVTVHATDHDNPGSSCTDGKCGSTTLGSLKSVELGRLRKNCDAWPRAGSSMAHRSAKGFPGAS